jgi:hypothetical protein
MPCISKRVHLRQGRTPEKIQLFPGRLYAQNPTLQAKRNTSLPSRFPIGKKLRSMQTVVMKDVNPVLPDSMKIGEEGLMGEDGVVPGAELDLAARSVIDSTYIVDVPQDTTQALGDSVYVISKDKEVRLLKYNTPDSAVYDETTGRFVPKDSKVWCC